MAFTSLICFIQDMDASYSFFFWWWLPSLLVRSTRWVLDFWVFVQVQRRKTTKEKRRKTHIVASVVPVLSPNQLKKSPQNAATRQTLIKAVGLDFGAMTGHWFCTPSNFTAGHGQSHSFYEGKLLYKWWSFHVLSFMAVSISVSASSYFTKFFQNTKTPVLPKARGAWCIRNVVWPKPWSALLAQRLIMIGLLSFACNIKSRKPLERLAIW